MKTKPIIKKLCIFLLLSLTCFAQVREPEIFPFKNKNIILLQTVGGFNFDNDEFLDILGIAAKTDESGQPVRGSTFLVHLEESVTKDFNVVWKYQIPKDIRGDFTDITVADLDNDQLPELCATLNVVESSQNGDPYWLYIFEYTNGIKTENLVTFSQSGELAMRQRPLFVENGDFNGDGNQDLIISSGSPARGISVISVRGELDEKNLYFLYQSSDLDILDGMLPFRAMIAELDTLPGVEMLIFGGKSKLQASVFSYSSMIKPILGYTFSNTYRNQVDITKITTGDIDGNGYSEVVIPQKQGGALLLWKDTNILKSDFLFPAEISLEALAVIDKNSNGLDEIIFHQKNSTGIVEYEYDLSGYISDFSAYSRSVSVNHLLNNMKYLSINPVVTYSGKQAGSVIIPFFNPHYDQHGLCYWQFEENNGFAEKNIVDEVLVEIDSALTKIDSTLLDGEKPLFSELNNILGEYSGFDGEETNLSPVTESHEALRVQNLPKPDILAHVGEKVIHKLKIPGLSLENIQGLRFDVNTPEGMAFNLSNQVFEWVPADSQLGLYNVQAAFSWGEQEISKSFSIYVNDPPKITTKVKKRGVIQIGESFLLNISQEDQNENPAVFYKMLDYPSGASINQKGQITWKPSFNQVDWFDFIIEVSDGFDMAVIDFSLFVNHPVSIESKAPDLTTVGEPYAYTPVIIDKNRGVFLPDYVMSPKITDWQNSAVFETKILEGNTIKNLASYSERFNKEIDISPLKDYGLVETLTDESKLIFYFSGNTEKLPDPSKAIKAFFGHLKLSIPRYTKPVRIYLYNYNLKEGPVGMQMSPFGKIRWTPNNQQYDFQTLSYTVTDGFFTAEEHAQIYVNHVPTIVSTPEEKGYVNRHWEYDVKVTDLNTDSKIQYTLINEPSGMVISTEGKISWRPTEIQINEHQFTIIASDGMSQDKQECRIFVNIKPKILSIPKPVAVAGLEYEYQFRAKDPNGDPIVYKAMKLPTGARFDPTTGLLVWKPDKKQKGVNNIVLEVVDSHGESAVQEFQIHVFHNPGGKGRSFIKTSLSVIGFAGIVGAIVYLVI